MQAVTVQAGSDRRESIKTHGFSAGLSAHAIEVIHEGENDWQAPPVFGLPQIPELAHGGKVHRLPNGPAAGRGVADVCDRDAGSLCYSSVKSGADSYVGATTDESVIRIDSEGGEECVHGSSQPPVESRRAREDFSQQAVDEIVDGQLLDARRRFLLNDPQNVAI